MSPEILINAWAQALVHHFPEWPGRSMIDAQTEEAFFAELIFQKDEEDRLYFQAFTLSQANLNQPGSRPELYLRLASAHEVWFDSLLHLLEDMADQEIVPGMMVRFNAPIAPDTGLNAWVIGFTPWKVELSGGVELEYLPVIPIFEAEIELLSRVGFAKFTERLGDELFNPYRAKISEE